MKPPVSYDPQIIIEFAQRMYRRANSVVATTALMGFILGAVIGGGIAILAAMRGDGVGFAGVGASIGALAGFVRGRELAFKLKLEAQIALCQVQIEANGRSA